MFLTVHTAFAILIAKYSSSIILAFIFGWVSHYLLDAIPHGDKELGEWLEKKQLNKIFIVTITDAIIAINFIGLIIFWGKFNIPLHFIWAATAGAVLPDLINAFDLLAKPRFLEIPNRVHYFFHNLIENKITKPFSLKYGLVLQIIVLAIIFYFL